MKNKKRNLILGLFLIIVFILNSFYVINKNSINNLQFTTGEVQLYEYQEDIMDEEESVNEEGVFVSNANDLKDYYNGYQIKLSELKPLEEHFNIDIVYFLVNYSTTDKDAVVSIGLKSKKEIDEKTIKSFVKWIEENEKSYIGKNDLKYKSLNIEVMNEYEQNLNIGDYSNSYLRKETYLTDETVIQQIYHEKDKEIMISFIERISQIEKSKLEGLEYNDLFDYEVVDTILDDLNNDLNVYLAVDSKEIEKVNFNDLIQFSVQFEKLNKTINESEDLAVHLTIVDKENYEENSFMFSSKNNRIFIKNNLVESKK